MLNIIVNYRTIFATRAHCVCHNHIVIVQCTQAVQMSLTVFGAPVPLYTPVVVNYS